jgi:hypothetical protein
MEIFCLPGGSKEKPQNFLVTVVGNKKSLSHDSLTFSEHSWFGTVPYVECELENTTGI